ncbi:MAG: hypothetical protein ACXW3U_07635 [Rhodoplanes sp.]
MALNGKALRTIPVDARRGAFASFRGAPQLNRQVTADQFGAKAYSTPAPKVHPDRVSPTELGVADKIDSWSFLQHN